MPAERDFIDLLRAFATDPAARGLADDAAVLAVGGTQLVLTHDMIVEDVHFLASDPPADVAWKLVAVNLSDLAAKGARPRGVLLGFPLGDGGWDRAFADGLRTALARFDTPLLGGDTVRPPAGAPRQLGLTAVGESAHAPSRGGALPGDHLYLTGRIGAAGLGLAIAQGRRDGPGAWLEAYRRPTPRLHEGLGLAPVVHAMCDVSDGLLIDAARIAAASGLGLHIDLDAVPLADPDGDRMAQLTAGDDYELLFAAPPGLTIWQPGWAQISVVGRFAPRGGLTLSDANGPVPVPSRLGYEHGAS
jgi:thiamine-monophosphate kinase